MTNATIKDYQDIENVMNKYVEGVKSGSSEIMKNSFHKGATMYGYLEGAGLLEGSINNLYSFVDQSGPADKLLARIDITEVIGTVASVRVELEGMHGANVVDLHQLLKVDGQWKIIGKVFHQL
ncbi:nuclear transport factor 2 family protein [Paenibacillus polymyxa]|uniref:nuclear transport factor 2 family protein n=1 Tax=Paenibacillus polymyxa TaxID=1406 RepID=UPI00234B199D|nr:nuclear transport factor 2 family protein [Paenibacillus polymyxa]WCM60726.1 nuclear transport factor 2 family protein [Paenibacillus polymyxa]